MDILTALVGTGEVVTLLGEFGVDRMTAVIGAHDDLKLVSLEEGRILISMEDAKTRIPALLQELLAAGISVDSLPAKEPSLQDVFIKLTGRELRN